MLVYKFALWVEQSVEYQALRMHIDFASDCLFLVAMIIGVMWLLNNWNIK